LTREVKMKIEKIDHVHVLVKDLEKAMKFFSDIMGTQFIGPIEGQYNMVAFDNAGLELLSPKSPDSPFAKPMEKMEAGEGLFSIGLKVPDLDEALAELEAKGVKCTVKVERPDLKAAQLDPADAHGVVIELVEYDTVPSVALANMGKTSEIPIFKG
jgi:methylmalonyl-CoA/ethylmalonyl-CoA epimerase